MQPSAVARTQPKESGNGKAIRNTKEMFKIQCPIFIIQCVVDFRSGCWNGRHTLFHTHTEERAREIKSERINNVEQQEQRLKSGRGGEYIVIWGAAAALLDKNDGQS